MFEYKGYGTTTPSNYAQSSGGSLEEFDDEIDETGGSFDDSGNGARDMTVESNIDVVDDSEREMLTSAAAAAAAVDREAEATRTNKNDGSDKESVFSRIRQRFRSGKDGYAAGTVGTEVDGGSTVQHDGQNLGRRFFVVAGAFLCLVVAGILAMLLLTSGGSDSGSSSSSELPRPAPKAIAPTPAPTFNRTEAPSVAPTMATDEPSVVPSVMPSSSPTPRDLPTVTVEYGIVLASGTTLDETLTQDLVAAMDILAPMIWSAVGNRTSAIAAVPDVQEESVEDHSIGASSGDNTTFATTNDTQSEQINATDDLSVTRRQRLRVPSATRESIELTRAVHDGYGSSVRHLSTNVSAGIASVIQLPTSLAYLGPVGCPDNIFYRDSICERVASIVYLILTDDDPELQEQISQLFVDGMHMAIDDGTFRSILTSPDVNPNSSLTVFQVSLENETHAPTSICGCAGNQTATDCCPSQLPSTEPSVFPSMAPSVPPFPFDQCSPTADCCVNGLDSICDLRVDQILYVTPHNAMASRDEGFQVFPHHQRRLEDALDAGLRGLHLGVCNCDGTYVLCDEDCRLGSRSIDDVFGGVQSFLDSNPSDVLLLLLELYDDAGDAVVLDDLYASLDGVDGFVDRLYAHGDSSEAWPTLRSVVDSGTRVLLFHYGSASCEDGCPVGMHYWPDYAGQTEADFQNIDAIFDDPLTTCELALGETVNGSTAAPFFSVAYHIVNPRISDSTQLNGFETANSRITQCSELQGGATVNVLLVDNWASGDLVQVQQEYNANIVDQ